MQSNDASPGTDEPYFARIPFDKVYHEGPNGGDSSITAHRCAEVLPTSPLVLEDCLRAVLLRSDPERETLLHLLGSERARWAGLCHVSEALKVFEKRHSFVHEVGLERDGVVFTLNRRFDGRGVAIQVGVWDNAGHQVANFAYADVPAAPAEGRWICRQEFADGLYRVRIDIEGHLAFESLMPLGPALF